MGKNKFILCLVSLVLAGAPLLSVKKNNKKGLSDEEALAIARKINAKNQEVVLKEGEIAPLPKPLPKDELTKKVASTISVAG